MGTQIYNSDCFKESIWRLTALRTGSLKVCGPLTMHARKPILPGIAYPFARIRCLYVAASAFTTRAKSRSQIRRRVSRDLLRRWWRSPPGENGVSCLPHLWALLPWQWLSSRLKELGVNLNRPSDLRGLYLV